MTGRRHDIVVAGGGLAGGLIALALHMQRPDLSVLLLEGGDRLGGGRRHTWISAPDPLGLLDRMRISRWQSADFAFPGTYRHLSLEVQSMAAGDFDAGLRRELPKGGFRLRAPVARLGASGVLLESGEDILARTVIDCRGFERSASLDLGWRTSLERSLACNDMHRVAQPMLVDAGGEQGGVLAFAQVLPLGASELVVGEHRLSRRATIDRRELSTAIEATCSRAGWQGRIIASETGVRPLVAGGSLAVHYDEIGSPGVPLAGSRGLFLHPLTGSSMASALSVAAAVAAEADLPGEQLAAMLADRARKHWQAMKAPRKLVSRLLAAHAQGAARAAQVAGLPEASLARLLGGKATMVDRLRLTMARA